MAAWGSLTAGKKSMYVRSYELGVLVLPTADAASTRTQADALILAQSAPSLTNPIKGTPWAGLEVPVPSHAGSKPIVVPLPYDFPPARYAWNSPMRGIRTPWTSDGPFARGELDRFGRDVGQAMDALHHNGGVCGEADALR
jgi:hypothetical protein